MKQIKMPIEIQEWLERKDMKTKLKKIGVGLTCAATCIIGYKVGRRVEHVLLGERLGMFLYANPELKENFINTINKCNVTNTLK